MTNWISKVGLSGDGQFVEAWNNGTRVLTAAIRVYGLRGAVDTCRRYLKEWAADENPRIDGDLADALREEPMC